MVGRSPKPIVFLGDSLDQLRAFPEGARRQAGVQLHKVQLGFEPSEWKPMRTVGTGAVEIRIRDDRGGVSSDLFRQARRHGLRLARVPEEDRADAETGTGPCDLAFEADLAETL